MGENKKGCREYFGERLKSLRAEKGISQRVLADELGISKGAVSFYETCQNAPDIEILEAVSNYFKVSYDYLLGRTDIQSTDMNLRKACEYLGISQKSGENLCFISQGGWSADILLESGWLGAFVRLLTNIDEWVSKLNYYNQVIEPSIGENITLNGDGLEQEIRNVMYFNFRNIVNSQVDSAENIEHLDYEYRDKIDLYEFKLDKVLKSMVEEIKADHKADKMIFELSNESIYNRLIERKKNIDEVLQASYESEREYDMALVHYKDELDAINTILKNFDEYITLKKGTEDNG